MLSFVILYVIRPNVSVLNAIMLNVVAPSHCLFRFPAGARSEQTWEKIVRDIFAIFFISQLAWKHSVFCNFKMCWQRQIITLLKIFWSKFTSQNLQLSLSVILSLKRQTYSIKYTICISNEEQYVQLYWKITQ